MKTTATKSAVTASTPAVKVPSISADEISTFVDAIDAFAQALGDGFVVPQPSEVKRLPKARKEAPTIVPMIADLSTRYAIASSAYPQQTTVAQQQLVNTLAPVVERIAAVQKLVGTVVSVAQSGAWAASMVTYGLMKSEARGNAVLRNALGTVRDKLRPTYETEDGGKTTVRSKAKKSTTAKAAAATTTAPASPSEDAEAPVAAAATAPAAVPVAATEVAKS